jgi:hypothetical protein
MLRDLLDTPQVQAEGWDTVSFMVGGSGSVVVGGEHLGGYAMTREGNTYRCYEAWSNSFTAGISIGGSSSAAISFSRGRIEGFRGESNGIAGIATVGVGYVSGLHWTTANQTAIPDVVVYGVGVAGIDAGIDYVHTWTDHGEEISCDSVL